MLRVFFFVVSLITDYQIVGDIFHRALTVGVINAGLLGLIAARLGFRRWLATKTSRQALSGRRLPEAFDSEDSVRVDS